MIEKKTVPYEFLVRFNHDGTIKGQHIKYLEVLVDADQVLSEKEGDALPVGDGGMLLEAALGEVGAGLSRATEAARESERRMAAHVAEVASAARHAIQAQKDAEKAIAATVAALKEAEVRMESVLPAAKPA